MGFRDLHIKSSYDSNIDDVVDEFYIPTLSNATRYDRIAGFFTSSSLAISARGILNIADKGGHIRFLASPRLNRADVDLIEGASSHPDKYINDALFRELLDDSSDIVNNYRALLGHLIANNTVEIRLVIVNKHGRIQTFEELESSAMFHQKVGVMYDDNGNVITFSGSINESFNAWNDNIEEFKTFRSWEKGLEEYCRSDIDKFEDYWNNRRPDIRVMPLPEAVKKKFIEFAETTDFDDIRRKIKGRTKRRLFNDLYSTLFPFQKEAFDKWIENNCRMLFAMATGTGKTRTAITCLAYLLEKYNILAVIATPQTSLSKQWSEEFDALGMEVDRKMICDSTNPRYKEDLPKYVSWMKSGGLSSLALFVTHTTASSKFFTETIKPARSSCCKLLFIGDEVHGMGSKEYRNALLEEYDCRIGLSATPQRWFDDEGSKLLMEYFDNACFEFGIKDAITTLNPMTGRTFLSQYKYFIRPVYLTDDEDEDYKVLSQKIASIHGKDDRSDEIRTLLLTKRARIVKNAERKMDTFDAIVDKIKAQRKLKNTIIFCSDSDHVDMVLSILKEKGVMAAALTEKQDSRPDPKYGGKSERDFILQAFRDEDIEALVSIKCMDEGIDIPSADTAIILSSTTNPREYIQRIGRVIRQYPGKRFANIYDITVKSHDDENFNTIRKSELSRMEYIVELALNGSEAIAAIFDQEER